MHLHSSYRISQLLIRGKLLGEPKVNKLNRSIRTPVFELPSRLR